MEDVQVQNKKIGCRSGCSIQVVSKYNGTNKISRRETHEYYVLFFLEFPDKKYFQFKLPSTCLFEKQIARTPVNIHIGCACVCVLKNNFIVKQYPRVLMKF